MQTTKPCCAAWSRRWRPCPASRRSHWAARAPAARPWPLPTTISASIYRANRPIDVAALAKVVAVLDDRGAEASVTPIGGWGPWIDRPLAGGGRRACRPALSDSTASRLRSTTPMPARSSASTSPAIRTPSCPRSTWARRPAPVCCTIRPARSPTCSVGRRPIRRRSKALRERFEWEPGSRSPMRARASIAATSPTWRAAPSAPSPASARPCSR